MPSSWIAHFIGSDAKPVADTRTPKLDLSQGPVIAR
jgi:hypothetical protein